MTSKQFVEKLVNGALFSHAWIANGVKFLASGFRDLLTKHLEYEPDFFYFRALTREWKESITDTERNGIFTKH